MNLARNGLILAGAALVAVLTRSGEAVLLVSFTAMLVAGSLFVADGSIRLSRRFDAALARTLLAYGGPIFLSMVFSALMTSANPVMIGALSSQEAVGHYTIAFTLVQSTLGMIAQGVNVAIWPFAVRAVESGDLAAVRTQLSHNFTFLLGLVLPAGIGLALLAPGIARLFISPHYHEAIAQMTPWLSACAVLMALRASYVDAAFQLGKRTGLLAWITGLGALINLGLGALLIPRWSYLGAAIAMTCAFAFSMVHASVLAKRFYPMPFPLRETASITLATGIMSVVVVMALAVPGPLGLVVQVASGAASYGAALLVLDRLGLSAVLGGGLLARLLPSGQAGMQPPSMRVAPATPGEAPTKGVGTPS
jgi:O-antigen/teichoic acid export membrane protein